MVASTTPVFEIAYRAKIIAMPKGGATIFGDLIGKLEVLRVSCSACGRDGRYILARLIRKHGHAKHIDWLDELTADCPRKRAGNMNDPCGCPDLPKVL